METSHSQPGAVVLFDGVCNLCNASVRWFMDRDGKGRLRFASLQSAAGRRALEAAGAPPDLPDSIVVVRDGKVLTRSDAVLAAVGLLGFPWALLAGLGVLPRGLRDRLYDFVAARRYLWFGKQTVCALPTGELRGRFLEDGDAQEPIIAGAAAGPVGGGVGAWVLRLVIAYFVLYFFPFPLQFVPYVNKVADLWTDAKYAVVPWVGKAAFGVEITNFPGGSGDTLYNYVELAVFAAAALLASVVWTLLAKGRGVSPRTRDTVTTWLRYALGATMLSYGFAKVIPTQMPAPGPDRFIETVGDLSPMGLLWLFVGSSTPYQVFAGLGELVGGLLLLFRRTTLLGAIVVTGVMTNVVAFNFMYDVPVKLYSSHLLLTAIFLLAPHAARLAAVLVLNLPAQPVVLRPFPIRRVWARWTRGIVKAVVVLALTIGTAWESYSYAVGPGGPLGPAKPWHGVYRVESFSLDGVEGGALADDQRWVRVGLNSIGIGAIQKADGTARRSGMVLSLPGEDGSIAAFLKITRRGEPKPITLDAAAPEPGVITLAGDYEGKRLAARLRRIDDFKPLLTSRGFNWVQEFPFNR